MADWSQFSLVTGGAAAALVGLLFVAVTLRIEAVSRAPDLRSRAAQTLTLFVVALVVAILLTVPSQPEWVLGTELIAIALSGGAVAFALNRRAEKVSQQQPITRLLDRIGPNVTTMGLVLAAGVLLGNDVDWGTYLLVPAQLAALIGGVLSAWLFLTNIPDTAAE